MKQAVRQTRTHIGELLARHGLNPRHDLGQNFLVDVNLVEYLVAEADLGADDVVLEVGSGTGGLTAFLAEKAGAVISVEIDARMQQLAALSLAGFTNVTLLACDVLQNKNCFSKTVLDAVDSAVATTPPRKLKLVANLPYCIGTPVISNLVASAYPWERMTVTIQLELAQRFAAKEGTSNYGALSAWIQAQCRIELLKKLPPDVFWPRPKVESAMIRIDPDSDRRAAIRDRAFFRTFLRRLFQQRRKLLRSVLVAMYRGRLERPQIDDAWRSLDLGDHARAEELSPSTLVALGNRFFDVMQQSRGEDSQSSTRE